MSQKANQLNPEDYKTDNPEDEVELIDIFRVLWKWKYLIVGGAALCTLAALVISATSPEIYRLETVIRPGILSFEKGGKTNYIDSPENIKALIESGVFEKKILDNLNESKSSNIPKQIGLKVYLPRRTKTLTVTYESQRVEQGIEILDLLGKLLLEEYSNLIKHVQNEVDLKINIGKSELQKFTKIKRSSEVNKINIEKRINELKNELLLVKETSTNLNKEQKKLLSKGIDQQNVFSALILSNTKQNNLQISNDYKYEITDFLIQKETQLQKISELENKIQKQLAMIEKYEVEKKNIQNIQIMQKPYSRPYPVKPNKKLNVIVATLIGIVFMICLSFLLEYIIKNKHQEDVARKLG